MSKKGTTTVRVRYRYDVDTGVWGRGEVIYDGFDSTPSPTTDLIKEPCPAV